MGLCGNGMHEFVLMEAELGRRVAAAQDSEDCGWSAILDLQYEEWAKRERDSETRS